jgi:hypothetical protein
MVAPSTPVPYEDPGHQGGLSRMLYGYRQGCSTALVNRTASFSHFAIASNLLGVLLSFFIAILFTTVTRSIHCHSFVCALFSSIKLEKHLSLFLPIHTSSG